MKTIVFVMLACVVSPALADVYRCNSGGKTIYQDAPCPNAKVIDNINSRAPSPHEQMRAMERLKKDQALAAEFDKTRKAEAREAENGRATTSTTTQVTVSTSPVAPKTNRPDRYYDRPDRFNNRYPTERRPIQRQ
ncbi:MAG: DUF4124 domain-containing protein [Thiobacillus sp.]